MFVIICLRPVSCNLNDQGTSFGSYFSFSICFNLISLRWKGRLWFSSALPSPIQQRFKWILAILDIQFSHLRKQARAFSWQATLTTAYIGPTRLALPLYRANRCLLCTSKWWHFSIQPALLAFALDIKTCFPRGCLKGSFIWRWFSSPASPLGWDVFYRQLVNNLSMFLLSSHRVRRFFIIDWSLGFPP